MEERVKQFLIVSLLLFFGWSLYNQKMYPPAPAGQAGRGGQGSPAAAVAGDRPTTSTLASPAPNAPASGATTLAQAPAANVAAAPQPEGPTVRVTTKVYDILFSTNGGVPIRWDVVGPKQLVTKWVDDATSPVQRERLIDPALAAHRDLPRPFQTVLQDLGSRYYGEFNQVVYAHRQLDKRGLIHEFTSPPVADGLRMIKTYSFTPDGFEVKLGIRLVNDGASNVHFAGDDRGLGLIIGPGLGDESDAKTEAIARYGQVDGVLKAGDAFLYDHVGGIAEDAGPIGSTPGKTITLDRTHGMTGIQWGGLVGKYFMAVLIPDAANPATCAKTLVDNRVLGTLATEPRDSAYYPQIEIYGAPFVLHAGQHADFNYIAYVGPMQRDLLAKAGHDLSRALFHVSWDFTRAFCMVLMWLLFWLHRALGNWGVAIMALTFLVRLATLPLVHKGMKSQAKMTQQMSKLKPLIDKINEKYKDDPQRKQQETFKLYREHNVNPLGMLKGCGWMMVQMPIFIGLYALLYQAIDLRGAGFLWIKDLSRPDQLFAFGMTLPFLGKYFNLLPIIVTATQVMASKFMQAPATDSEQQQMQKMMTYMMPVMILAFTYRFPSGVMLYWFVSNAWQVVQQVYVNKVIRKPAAA
jgi:YidC/Oxa1 family membrane protein insertase